MFGWPEMHPDCLGPHRGGSFNVLKVMSPHTVTLAFIYLEFFEDEVTFINRIN